MKYFSIIRVGLQFFFYSFFLLFSGPHPFYAQASNSLSEFQIKRSVVILEITPVYYNAIRPWIQESKQSFHRIALVLPGKKLLVLANDIEKAGLIEVSQHRSYEKALAQVRHVDFSAKLALLSVNKRGFFKNLRPLALGKDLAPGSYLSGVRVDKLFQVYHERLSIQEINLVSEAGFTDLPLYNFRSQNNFPMGGLLLDKNKLCGFISYSDKEGEGEAILTSIIRDFLRNSKKKSKSSKGSKEVPAYLRSNFISQGFRLKNLVDPVKRSYYGIRYENQGAFVSRVLPGTSAWGVLRNGDILLSIDGILIDNLGLYEDIRRKRKGEWAQGWRRQNAELLLTMKKGRVRKAGEIAKLTILRKGKKKMLKMKLRVYQSQGERIPSRVQGPPNYLIENGIIFLELSVPLLKTLYGENWQQKAAYASYLFQTQRYYKKQNSISKKGKQRILIIGGVFPDSSTRGLESFRGFILEDINGKKILNLKSFRKDILELFASGQKTAKLSLHGNRPLYLDLEQRAEINARILKRYFIPAISSWDTKKP